MNWDASIPSIGSLGLRSTSPETTADPISPAFFLSANKSMTAYGPTLPTWALHQVVSYLGYTGRDAGQSRSRPKPLSERA